MIFLPIKPKFVNKILSWEKTVEFRKTTFLKNDDKLCLIYSSYPIKKIVWYFKYELDIIKSKEVYNKYWKIWWIDKESLDEYYKNKDFSCVMIIKELFKIDEKNVVDIFPWLKIPQSFCYLSEEQKEIILK
jgi:type I restriction enzyme S subunit